MRVHKVLDMAVFLMVGIAVLLPRPDAKAKPALGLLDGEARARVAELQAGLLRQPGLAEPSLELADLLLDGRRPDWALAALAPAIEATPNDYRLHMRRSLALAEHFEAAPASAAAQRALSLCEAGSSVPCASHDHARLTLLRSTLKQVEGFDMRKNPNEVKKRLIKALRPTYLPQRR